MYIYCGYLLSIYKFHTHTLYVLNNIYMCIYSALHYIDTLGKYEQRRAGENKSSLLIFLSFIQTITKICTFHWSKTIESGGENLMVK